MASEQQLTPHHPTQLWGTCVHLLAWGGPTRAKEELQQIHPAHSFLNVPLAEPPTQTWLQLLFRPSANPSRQSEGQQAVRTRGRDLNATFDLLLQEFLLDVK